MNAKFNPKPTRPKLDALKTKSTSNTQTIELNILINFIRKKILKYSNKKNLKMNNY
jgi:hypothetical protein